MVSTPTCLAIMSFVLWDAPASPFALGISFGTEGLLDRTLSAVDTHCPLVLCSFSSYFLCCFFRRELLTLNAVESSSPEIYATTFNFTFSNHCQSWVTFYCLYRWVILIWKSWWVWLYHHPLYDGMCWPSCLQWCMFMWRPVENL